MSITIKTAAKYLAFLLLLGVSLLLCNVVVLLILCSDRMSKQQLTPNNIEILDVLVISNEKPYIVNGHDLDDFIKEHLDSNFLVSAGREDGLNKELAISSNPLQVNKEMVGGFKVAQIPGGRQSFKVVTERASRTTTSWYEAEGQKITPRYVKFCSIGHSFKAIPFGLGLFLLFWGTIFLIYRTVRKSNYPQP